MIKLIHRYNQIITYVFLFVAICFMFSGVGLDILHSGQDGTQYAIKVNEKTISPVEFERTRENIVERYQQMFGPNFETLAKSLNFNPTQQAIDGLVDTNLLNQEAAEWGFAADEDAVKKYLVEKVFAGREISEEGVRSMLQNVGMNYRQFSSEVREELAREAFMNVLRDVAFVGMRDIEAQYIRQETTFSLEAAKIADRDLVSAVAAPSDDVLKKRYESTATTYELPARVSYEYITLMPKDFEKDVPLTPADVELFYTENPSRFRTPEEVRVRSIKILYPKDNDPTAMAAVQERATAVHQEALAGKPFEDLVTKHSEDLPSKLAGGNLGWVQRGQNSKAFDSAVFSAGAGAVADLVKEDFGFQIVKVDEKKDAGTKPFETVKAEIESLLRSREAPSFAAAKARAVVDEAKRSLRPVREVAATMGLPAPQRAVLVPSSEDPDPLVRGLTQQVMRIPPPDRLIATTFDIGENSIALQITDFKEPTTPSFAEVREKVLQEYKLSEAKKLAETRAKELQTLVDKTPGTLAQEAKNKGATVYGPFEISRLSPSSSTFADLTQEMTNDAFASTAAPRSLGKVYRVTDGFVVAAVAKTKQPDPKASGSEEKIDKYQQRASAESSQKIVSSTISVLKTRATIDVDKSLLVRR